MAPKTLDPDARVFQIPYIKYKVWLPVIVAQVAMAVLFTLTIVFNDLPLDTSEIMIAVLSLMCVMGFISLVTYMSARASFNNYIAISPRGIEHVAPGIRLYAPWEATIKIDSQMFKNRGRYRVQVTSTGIMVDENEVQYHISDFAKRFSLNVPGIWGRFIPLEHFASGDWRDHEIGKLIQQYAPHLYETL